MKVTIDMNDPNIADKTIGYGSDGKKYRYKRYVKPIGDLDGAWHVVERDSWTGRTSWRLAGRLPNAMYCISISAMAVLLEGNGMKLDHNNLHDTYQALNEIAKAIEDRDDLPVDFTDEVLNIIREVI